jgi:hypothetical protein
MIATMPATSATTAAIRALPKNAKQARVIVQRAGTCAAIILLLALVASAVDLLGTAMGGSLTAYGAAAGIIIALVALVAAQLAQYLS